MGNIAEWKQLRNTVESWKAKLRNFLERDEKYESVRDMGNYFISSHSHLIAFSETEDKEDRWEKILKRQ